MTYQQKLQELGKILIEKNDPYIKSSEEISSKYSFIDKSALDNFLKAKAEFEIAIKNYHDFLDYISANAISLNDELHSIV